MRFLGAQKTHQDGTITLFLAKRHESKQFTEQ